MNRRGTRPLKKSATICMRAVSSAMTRYRGLIVEKKNDSRTLMFCLVDAVRMMVLDPTIPVKINAMT